MRTPPDLASARVAPETLGQFRAGQLLLLLAVLKEDGARPIGIDRLGYCEFFAANPFLVVEPRSPDGRRLLAAGFEYLNLDYQSSSQRYTNRRARLQRDLATLTSLGLVAVQGVDGRVGYEASEEGVSAAASLRATYALAYRTSAGIVIGRLKRLSDSRLRDDAARWLKADALLVDIYDT